MIQEIKRVNCIAKDDAASTFSATPLLESLRLLLSITMTFSLHSSDPDKMLIVRFLDISRAHPHCDIRRRVFIRLPKEAHAPKDHCGLLNKKLYGTRDAKSDGTCSVDNICILFLGTTLL